MYISLSLTTNYVAIVVVNESEIYMYAAILWGVLPTPLSHVDIAIGCYTCHEMKGIVKLIK